MHLPLLLFPHLVVGLHAVAGHDVPQDQGAGLEHMVVVGGLHGAAEVALELAGNHFGELFLIVLRGIVRHNSTSCFVSIKGEHTPTVTDFNRFSPQRQRAEWEKKGEIVGNIRRKKMKNGSIPRGRSR